MTHCGGGGEGPAWLLSSSSLQSHLVSVNSLRSKARALHAFSSLGFLTASLGLCFHFPGEAEVRTCPSCLTPGCALLCSDLTGVSPAPIQVFQSTFPASTGSSQRLSSGSVKGSLVTKNKGGGTRRRRLSEQHCFKGHGFRQAYTSHEGVVSSAGRAPLGVVFLEDLAVSP